MIQLTQQPIDSQAAVDQLQSTAEGRVGALVLFLGLTREFTSGRRTLRLDYEAYGKMAEQQLADLEQQARQRWPLVECLIIHRLGTVELNDASILVGISAAHRVEAFEAAQWLMDSIKRDVPIWKQENWADGTKQWVHPGAETARITESSPPTAGDASEGGRSTTNPKASGGRV